MQNTRSMVEIDAHALHAHLIACDECANVGKLCDDAASLVYQAGAEMTAALADRSASIVAERHRLRCEART